MKKLILSILLVLPALYWSNAQSINWKNTNENYKNLVYLRLGYDYGVTTQLGYARNIKFIKPSIINIDYSFPMGRDLIDDFKVKSGINTKVWSKSSIAVSVKIQGTYKRYSSELISINSFGSEFSTSIGFYKPGWNAVLELGIDNTTASHLEHKAIITDSYSDIKNGWYLDTAEYLFYGIQVGKTIKEKSNLSLRIGATNARGKDKDALLPIYAQIEVSRRF